MDALIREYRPQDTEPVVEVSLRAWAPVFASLTAARPRDLHPPARRVAAVPGARGARRPGRPGHVRLGGRRRAARCRN